MIEVVDQIGPRAAEAELQQARSEVREQRRAAERDRAARAAPVPDERRQQDNDDPARGAAADPACTLHERDEGGAAFVDAEREGVRALPVRSPGPPFAHGRTDTANG